VANALAYYNTATITAVKGFIVQAPGQAQAFVDSSSVEGQWPFQNNLALPLQNRF